MNISWQRLDTDGRETAALEQVRDGWRLSGTSSFLHEARSCRLEYEILCDSRWHTRWCHVIGNVGEQRVDVVIEADDAQRWSLNGARCPPLDGCIDVDLNFSPSTNLLPIRRLSLSIGQSAEVVAAWLRFPSFSLEPLHQRYRRLGPGLYRYESAGREFVRELTVDADGFVIDYPGFWTRD